MANLANLAVIHDEQHQRLEVKLRRELGDGVLSLLEDDRTEDVLLNPDSTLWVKRMGEGFAKVGQMPSAQAASALGTIAAWRRTVLNHDHPILETELPIDGSRFEGIVAPVVRRPVFAIRLRPRKIFTLADYEAGRILTDKPDPLNRLRRRDDFGAFGSRPKSCRCNPQRNTRKEKHSRRWLYRKRQNNPGKRNSRLVRAIDAS